MLRQYSKVIVNLIDYIFIWIQRAILKTKIDETTDTAILDFMKKRYVWRRFYKKDDFIALNNGRTFVDDLENGFIVYIHTRGLVHEICTQMWSLGLAGDQSMSIWHEGTGPIWPLGPGQHLGPQSPAHRTSLCLNHSTLVLTWRSGECSRRPGPGRNVGLWAAHQRCVKLGSQCSFTRLALQTSSCACPQGALPAPMVQAVPVAEAWLTQKRPRGCRVGTLHSYCTSVPVTATLR